MPHDKAPNADDPLLFDVGRAHMPYRILLGDAESLIKGKHLLIVPSGALITLPFQVLVTKPPTSASLGSASWLIRKHAITVLPLLAALRRTGKPSTAPKPMIGFANPLLTMVALDPNKTSRDRGSPSVASFAKQAKQTSTLTQRDRDPANGGTPLAPEARR